VGTFDKFQIAIMSKHKCYFSDALKKNLLEAHLLKKATKEKYHFYQSFFIEQGDLT